MIPLSTTSISVLRLNAGSEYDEPYAGTEPHNRTLAASGVRAVIDRPAGNVVLAGGEQAVADYDLICDETDIGYGDLIQDDTTGRTYRITQLITYPGEHVEAGLRAVEGET